MLIRRDTWRFHLPWIVVALLLLVGSIASGGYLRFREGVWPGGSSLPGFIIGVVAALIMLFEFALWLKKQKKLRNLRIGRAKVWMAAHIWLGLVCLPLAHLHSGFAYGGWLTSALMLLLWVVIISGVYGLILQQIIPRVLLEEIPAETIYSQIDHLIQVVHDDARRLVMATCGIVEKSPGGLQEVDDDEEDNLVLVAGIRQTGRLSGRSLLATSQPTQQVKADPLREYFQHTISPFLQHRTPRKSPLRHERSASESFDKLRAELASQRRMDEENERLKTVVGQLEDMCSQRRQWMRQSWLHMLLHSWLLVHTPVSLLLMVMLGIHIFFAVKYW